MTRKSGRRQKRRESTLALIDRTLLSTVQINLNGKVTRITALQAIMYRLFQKEMAGSSRAARVLQKYQDLARWYASKQLELEFGDTRNLAAPEGGHE